ncbi:MAG TPA: beta-1,3-glucanase family protein [Verrucomicrobiae bacterium]|nr:beta-1,3-glucanase family protein [Verrucomicrobiae bacterium]
MLRSTHGSRLTGNVMRGAMLSFAAVSAVLVASCGGGGRVLPAGSAGLVNNTLPGAAAAGSLTAAQMSVDFPKSVSPHSIVPLPMPVTAKQPASAMTALTNGRRARMSIGPLTWTQLPGAASSLAISPPDGSVWALSTQPAGPNKYIWHYNGTWNNVPGLAASIAVDPAGNLYAVNSTTGGVYEYPYNGTSWSSLGGGAGWVTAGRDLSVYVLSNGNIVNGNSAIWKYAGGNWTQVPGVGSQIAGSFDPNVHSVNGVGTMNPNGFFIINSGGSIYYYSPTVGYLAFPGAASSVGPATGGLFVLGYPPSANGEALYYFDYTAANWTAEAGSGVSLAANGGSGGSGPQLYTINSAGGIWTTLSQTVAFTVTIATAAGNNATINNPKMTPANTNIYIFGKTPPGSAPAQWVYLTNASGATAPFSGAVAPIPFYGGSTTSGNTSQVIQLPPLDSARVYLSQGPLSITSQSGPAPWADDGSQSTFFDFAEYTWLSTMSTIYVDTSQVDAMGLALSFNLVGAQNQTGGFLGGAVTQVYNGIQALPSPNAWSFLATDQWPYRVLAPDPVQYAGNPSVPGFTQGNFLDAAILTAWNQHQAPNWITVSSGVLGTTFPLYGQVNATTEDMNFYTSESATGTPYVAIPSLFSNAYGFTQSATQDVMLQNGPFLLPGSGPNSGSWPGNATNPAVAGTIGNVISTAMNRGILGASVTCPPPSPLFPGAAYQNQYAAAVWTVATNSIYGYSGAYNFPYADQCGLSTTKTDTAPQTLSVTINQS